MSNKDVAAKYGVQKSTLSTWVKNKEKILDCPEKERTLSDKNWEQIALKWWTKLFSIGS